MSAVRPYAQLRHDIARRDRSLREKVVSLEQATSFVRDGDAVGIGGSTMSRTPMGMIWALIRTRNKQLICSRCIPSTHPHLPYRSRAPSPVITTSLSPRILSV